MCSGERSSSANGAMLARAAAASGCPISSRRVLSDCTINGPSVTGHPSNMGLGQQGLPAGVRGNLSSVPHGGAGPARCGDSAHAARLQLVAGPELRVQVADRGKTGPRVVVLHAVAAYEIERDAELQLGPQLLQLKRSDQVARP